MASTTGPPIDYVEAVSIPLEGIFYGFSLCMFGATCFELIQRSKPSGQLNYKMLVTASLLFIFSTMYMGIDIYRLVEGLVKHRDTVDGPILYLNDFRSFSWLFRIILYVLQTFLGDGIVIYRCYVVWSTIWIVILPIVLWLGNLVTGSALLWLFAHAPTSGNESGVFNTSFSHWISAFFACTLTANLSATGLLAFRLWSLDRAASGFRTTKGNITHVARVIVDSGAIYSGFLVIILGLFASKNNIQTIIMNIIMPVISICFYLIILRVSRHQKSLAKSLGSNTSRGNFPSLGSNHRDGIRMRNLEVHLSTDVEIEREGDARKPANKYVLQEEQV